MSKRELIVTYVAVAVVLVSAVIALKSLADMSLLVRASTEAAERAERKLSLEKAMCRINSQAQEDSLDQAQATLFSVAQNCNVIVEANRELIREHQIDLNSLDDYCQAVAQCELQSPWLGKQVLR